MNKKEIIRHILGYLAGGSIFLAAIPVLLYLVSTYFDGLLGFTLIAQNTIRILISCVIFIIAAFFMLFSNTYLFFVGKGGPTDVFGVVISPQSKKLVIRGPYKYTRNPMVFGAFSLYLSEAIFLNSPAAGIFLLVFYPSMILYLKIVEEKRLLRDFGKDYEEYRKRVSMIVPLPPK